MKNQFHHLKVALRLVCAIFAAFTVTRDLKSQTPDVKVVARPWIDAATFERLHQDPDLNIPQDAAGDLSFELPESSLDLGQPVREWAFGPDGDSFALLNDKHTVLRFSGELAPREKLRFSAISPVTEMVALQNHLVLSLRELRVLEFRPYADLSKSYQWKIPAGGRVVGIGVSAKESRAPIVIWVQGAENPFHFLHPKTFETMPWKLSPMEEDQNATRAFLRLRKGDSPIERLKVSDDGRSVDGRQFRLRFESGYRVIREDNRLVETTDYQTFRGRKLPFGFSGFRVAGESGNHLFISGPRSASAMTVLDRNTLRPLCMIVGMHRLFDRLKGHQNFMGKDRWRIFYNEESGDLILVQGGKNKQFVYNLPPKKIQATFPFQSCPVSLPLTEDSQGRMTVHFADHWEGEEQEFRLLTAPRGSEIDSKTGVVEVHVPPNPGPGSLILLEVEGRHSSGARVLFHCQILIPQPQ